MEVITIINQKGGVGKTTTALNLASGLTKRKKRTLVIDLDAQANITFSVLLKIPEKSITDVFMGKEIIKDCIYKTSTIDIIGATPQLTATVNLKSINVLKDILKAIKKEYDYIIIDTPPAINMMTLNALATSNKAVITAQADIYSLQGIKNLYENIETIKEYGNKNLEISGILLTRYNSRSILTRDMTENMEKMAESIGTKVFNTKIRECIAIKEAQTVGINIFDYAKNSNGSKDYNKFIDELIGESEHE